MKKWTPVEVYWLDACGYAQWAKTAIHSDSSPAGCSSVGYLLKSDKECVVLALNRDHKNDNVDSSMCIPRGMVKSMRRLK